MVNAYDAVYSWNYDCANRGMDITADLAGTLHYGGRANVDENGIYYIMGLDGYQWTDGSFGVDGYQWTDGSPLSTNGYQWTDGFTGSASTETMSINSWVDQE